MMGDHKNSFFVILLLAILTIIVTLLFVGGILHLGAFRGTFGGGD